jgi:drug/metabolite transporter (DMT)-like permease
VERSGWPQGADLSFWTVINLLFLGVCCSAVAYIGYIYAVKRLGATLTASFLNLVPVVTVISGFLVLHETLTWIQFMGICLIMFSLLKLNGSLPTIKQPN